MPVTRVSDRYSSDKAQAKKAIEEMVAFILDNLKWLREVDRGGRQENFINEILSDVEAGCELRDW